MKNVMLNVNEVNTKIPLDTAALLNPTYDAYIYRWGRVRLDHVYFGLVALDHHGYKKEANILLDKLINNAENLSVRGQ